MVTKRCFISVIKRDETRTGYECKLCTGREEEKEEKQPSYSLLRLFSQTLLGAHTDGVDLTRFLSHTFSAACVE